MQKEGKLQKMNRIEKFIGQYRNLPREIYVLFWGRIVTCMGSLIWPLMTLILKNKLGYSATAIAFITMVMGVVQFPMLLLGGKLADSRNRKHIIVVCDLVTVLCYVIAGLIPLSNTSIVLFYIAGVFATIEGPSYDALVADLSDSESRERPIVSNTLAQTWGWCWHRHWEASSLKTTCGWLSSLPQRQPSPPPC